ncbi:DNA-processing protein DprA [Catenovulum sediminis]|uniref:DNA-processing protein DprA n=1 Tax=Catenovulum sediminis TaxID=1740262 RepID=A0ABV1RDZ3_9ALTE|nr:DNA-processing protein DprA [Catenovulum sediminis]
MESLSNWLRLKQVRGVQTKHWLALLAKHSLESILNSPSERLLAMGFKNEQIAQIQQPNSQEIEHQLNWLSAADKHHIVPFDDVRYPAKLKEISSPPLILYAIGDTSLLNEPQIALVGSRNASHYGCNNALSFAKDLSLRGLVVTSGFASGIDGNAHKGAIAGSGKTIAVFGTGPDVIYPSRHKSLYQEVLENGLILSEFPPGTQARPQHFPRRNRIISGLSLGVLVVEAAIKSGSLITAKYALEQDREVYAVPGSIHDPRSRGAHHLIQQGAKLVETTSDILEEVNQQIIQVELPLFAQKVEKSDKENFTSNELLVNLDYEVTSIDELVARTQQSIEVVLSQLLDLELQGLIAATSGGYIRLRRE